MENGLYGYSVEDFRDEAGDLLSRAENILSELSRVPDDRDKINALFRVIHSLKGSAGYAGLKDVNAFAHLYENLLADLRSNKHKVTPEILNLLIRARDYLDDIIFQPHAEPLDLNDSGDEPLRQLTDLLKDKRYTENIVSLEDKRAQGKGTFSPRENNSETAGKQHLGEGQQDKLVLTTQDPARMDQNDVIKISVINSLKSFYLVLKEKDPDRKMLEKSFHKLEETVLWAFGDSDRIIKPVEEIKKLISLTSDPGHIPLLRKLFNGLAIILREELSLLDKPEIDSNEVKNKEQPIIAEKVEEAPKCNSDAIRGASMEEIVNMTLNRSLETLERLLKEEFPEEGQIRKSIGRLKDLNRWAFNDDEVLNGSLSFMEDLLKRPYSESVARELGSRFSEIRPVFISLLEDKGEEKKDKTGRQNELQGTREQMTYKRRPPIQPSSFAGSTLRVRSEDVELLISAVGELSSIDPREFDKLQALALQLRMVQVGEIFGRFRKIVRDLAEELQKEIELEISGESVRLDKAIADRLYEPILHMVRNAASHGLEDGEEREKSGKGPIGLIRLNAYQEGGQVIIEVSDNGRGISSKAIRKRGVELGLIKDSNKNDLSEKALLDFIFTPGFSTAAEAGNVSGRGVGMDVVKEVITSLQGTVTIDTKENAGTTFRLQLPLTLAIIKGMVFDIAGYRVALPATFVDRVVTMTGSELEAGTMTNEKRAYISLAGEEETISLIDLTRIFDLGHKGNEYCIIVVKAGAGQKTALIADSVVGRHALMVKPLDRFAENRFFSSASVVNDELILLLNTPALMAA